MATVLEQVMHLSVQEKLDLISALWESVAEQPESIPVSDWQMKELERRVEAQRKDPQPGQTWGRGQTRDSPYREINRQY